jgi:hypothetical protein
LYHPYRIAYKPKGHNQTAKRHGGIDKRHWYLHGRGQDRGLIFNNSNTPRQMPKKNNNYNQICGNRDNHLDLFWHSVVEYFHANMDFISDAVTCADKRNPYKDISSEFFAPN